MSVTTSFLEGLCSAEAADQSNCINEEQFASFGFSQEQSACLYKNASEEDKMSVFKSKSSDGVNIHGYSDSMANNKMCKTGKYAESD